MNMDGDIIKKWSSAKDAEIVGGFCHSNIVKVCNGKRKYHKGFKWKYKDGNRD